MGYGPWGLGARPHQKLRVKSTRCQLLQRGRYLCVEYSHVFYPSSTSAISSQKQERNKKKKHGLHGHLNADHLIGDHVQEPVLDAWQPDQPDARRRQGRCYRNVTDHRRPAQIWVCLSVCSRQAGNDEPAPSTHPLFLFHPSTSTTTMDLKKSRRATEEEKKGF